MEFLNLTNVTCDAMTLRGTGVVTVTVAKKCKTGQAGSRVVAVDLGPAQPVSEPQAAGSSHMYGRTVTVPLTKLHP